MNSVKTIINCLNGELSDNEDNEDSELNAAILSGNYAHVHHLLKKGIDVNEETDNCQDTPLVRACCCSQVSIIKLLLENGAHVNIHGGLPLFWAVRTRSFETVKLLFDHGAQVKVPTSCNNDRDRQLLHVAVRMNNIKIVKILCEHGADVNEQDQAFGETPLFSAVRANNFEIIEHLLELGSSVNTIAYDLTTPLHLAAGNMHRNIDILQLLLDNGALVNAKDQRGYIPLMTCLNTSFRADPGMVSICECLVRHGSLVNDEHCHHALETMAENSDSFPLFKLCVAAGLKLNRLKWDPLCSQAENEQKAMQSVLITFIQTQIRNPRPLSDSCRVAIRTYLTGCYQGASIYYQIQKLPLPECIILFLLLEE